MEKITLWVMEHKILVGIVVAVAFFMLFADGSPDFSSFGEGK